MDICLVGLFFGRCELLEGSIEKANTKCPLRWLQRMTGDMAAMHKKLLKAIQS
jgi:hypothetical protein